MTLVFLSISEWAYIEKVKTGCKQHLQYSCPVSPFNVQVIEISKGSGYDNNKVVERSIGLEEIQVMSENFPSVCIFF